jgi:hypothetical protein
MYVIFIQQVKVEEIGMTELMRHNAPEWHCILIGCINSIIHGGLQPVLAILFGSVLGVSVQPTIMTIATSTMNVFQLLISAYLSSQDDILPSKLLNPRDVGMSALHDGQLLHIDCLKVVNDG